MYFSLQRNYRDRPPLPPLSGKPLLPVKSGLKRQNEEGLSSEYEPDIEKKPKRTASENEESEENKNDGSLRNYEGDFNSDNEEELSDDGSTPDDEAREELDRIMRKYKHKVYKKEGLEEEDSDIGSEFNDAQMENTSTRYKEKQAELGDTQKEDKLSHTHSDFESDFADDDANGARDPIAIIKSDLDNNSILSD